MAKLSVSQAAGRLGVSPARVRQRIDDGSLVAEKIGGRWLVDLDASVFGPSRRGRPILPASVWWSLLSADVDGVRASVEQASIEQMAQRLSRSSRGRAEQRLASAVRGHDHDALLEWLSHRASRELYVAAPPDLAAMKDDHRLVFSGVSHRASGIEDPRLVEAYVHENELDHLVGDHWLEKPRVDDRPNVVLHVVPVRLSEVGATLIAADLAEHGGPRERQRARELLDEATVALESREKGSLVEREASS